MRTWTVVASRGPNTIPVACRGPANASDPGCDGGSIWVARWSVRAVGFETVYSSVVGAFAVIVRGRRTVTRGTSGSCRTAGNGTTLVVDTLSGEPELGGDKNFDR